MDGARTGAPARTNTTADVCVPRGPLLAPFPGLRYAPEVAGPLRELVAPPHTELGHAARAAFLASSPYVVTHLERPEYGDGAGPAVHRWLQAGVLVQDRPGFYVLRQHRDDGRVQHFLVAALTVHPDDRRVLPHEDVFDRAVTSRLERLQATGVDSEPVLLVDSNPWTVDWTEPAGLGQQVSAAVDAAGAPLFEVWHLDDEAVVSSISAGSAGHDFLIADGHHRHAAVRRAAALTGEPQPLLVAIVDETREPVELGALHRLLPTGAATEVVHRAANRWKLPSGDAPKTRRIADDLHPDRALVVLHGEITMIQRPSLGDDSTVGSGGWIDSVIRDVGTPFDDLRYVAGFDDVWRRAEEGAGQAAIFLPRPEVAALQHIVRSGHTLGRKTTSFRPKPLAGAVLRLR